MTLAASLAVLAIWLVSVDVARRTVRGSGLARFSAVCLLAGYGWLTVAAALLILLPPAATTFGHDAAVHAIGLGFVLSMVFAHAPIILPAVAGLPVRYGPLLYGPAAIFRPRWPRASSPTRRNGRTSPPSPPGSR